MTGKTERDLAESLKHLKTSRSIHLMEVCGTHTVAIRRQGIQHLLPPGTRLISGPGCPVCVTPGTYIDEALFLARRGFILATFGDMIRVPGSSSSLQNERAAGSAIHVVYSPLEALQLAEQTKRQMVFLAVGFETTAPGIAYTIQAARAKKIANFSMLSSLRLIPPALEALVSEGIAIDGLLLPGHVSAIIGTQAYRFLRQIPIAAVISGFGAREILSSLILLLEMIEERQAGVVNNYKAVVREWGNPISRRIMEQTFEPCDAVWRGLGTIPGSGLQLRESLTSFDARKRIDIPATPEKTDPDCRCGDVLRGLIDPPQCPLFAKACTPDNPRGACMVSSEGSCQAWYRYS